MDYSALYGGRGVVADAEDQVRSEFVRKVYNLFFASLLISVGVAYVSVQAGVLPAVLPLLPALLIGGLIVGVVMAFTQRVSGLNLAMLALYAAIQGAIVGPVLTIVNQYAPGVPAQAAALTIAVFGGLSFYAVTSKKDFSYLGGMLTIAIVGLIVASLVMFFFQTPLLSMLYSVAGILIFGGFVLYDTSQIMRRLGPNDAPAGAIALYLDFVGLFWMILRLLMELNRRD